MTHIEPASTAFPSFAEWYAQPMVEPLTSSETLGWKGLFLHVSRVEAMDEMVPGPVLEEPTLIHHFSDNSRIQCWLDGKLYDERLSSGSMGLIPAQHGTIGRWTRPVSAAHIRFETGLIDMLAEDAFQGDPGQVRLIPSINFQAPVLTALVLALRHELRNPSPLSAVFAESAAQTMMLYLLRHHSNKTMRNPRARGKFSERQRRVIDDYIENHLDEKISLAELASLLFMSVAHFERTFRATMGCAPYQYVLERRLERARLLLETSTASVYEVGRQCGFANQSHFTRHFTKRYGVSPARYRQTLSG